LNAKIIHAARIFEGIEIAGSEYTYGGGGGIYDMTPKSAPNAKFRESIVIGEYKGSSADIRTLISDLRSDFPEDGYNLLTKNCNCFSNEFSLRLTGKPIPSYVNRLATLGSYCSCLLPPELQGKDPTQSGSAPAAPKKPLYTAFAGSGQTLSGPSCAPSAAGADDAASRREKMRQAALARLGRQHESQ
jgi:hypothetical protein